jgi:hypothetical protein
VTLRALLRRVYGVRMRMLHERAAVWGDANEMDSTAFCWTGRTGKTAKRISDGQRASDHAVNVLAAQISREGFNLERLQQTYQEWTGGHDGK